MCSKEYIISDKLMEIDNKHCAALVITENVILEEHAWPRFAQPSDKLRNGTITFFASSGRVYGITCWHVVQYFRSILDKSGNPHSHTMRTMVNEFYVVIDRFIQPKAEFGQTELDIAIRELNPEFPKALGKEVIDLDYAPSEPTRIEHAYAVGFPESLKYKKFENQFGYRVSMPHLSILAEIDGFPTQRFSLFSQLEIPAEYLDYSGMSGGPIFWSTEERYGILGIIYESASSLELFRGNSIHVSGELATPNAIQRWIKQYHENA